MRPEGEVRVVLQQKRKELAKVQALLQVRKAEREVAVQLRDKAFSAEMMKYRSNHASVGLTFGNVDVHFSYYYSLHGKAVPHRIDFESIARDYVDFVASLPTQP